MISNKNITPQIVKEIIEKGKTKTIKGFTSKAGKKFNAKLKLTEKGVEFDFNKKNEYLTKICRHLKIDLGAYFY